MEEFSKAQKGDWYPALIKASDKKYNLLPASPYVNKNNFSQTYEVLHSFLILHLVPFLCCLFLALVRTC